MRGLPYTTLSLVSHDKEANCRRGEKIGSRCCWVHVLPTCLTGALRGFKGYSEIIDFDTRANLYEKDFSCEVYHKPLTESVSYFVFICCEIVSDQGIYKNQWAKKVRNLRILLLSKLVYAREYIEDCEYVSFYHPRKLWCIFVDMRKSFICLKRICGNRWI